MEKVIPKQKKETKLQKENHTEHGLYSNIAFLLKKIWNCEPAFFVYALLGIITTPTLKYLWTISSKVILDIVAGEKTETELYFKLAVLFLVQLLAGILDTLFTNEIFWRYMHTRFEMIYEKNRKIMRLDYERLEEREIMDCYKKADKACSTNKEGIEGMMRAIVNVAIHTMIVVVGFFILGTMNLWLGMLLTLLAVICFLIQNQAYKRTKIKIWDSLSTTERRHSYLQKITTDFSAAKEIRMYFADSWLLKKQERINQILYEAQKNNEKILGKATAAYHFLWALAQVFVYAWLIFEIVNKNLTVGSFTLYVTSSTILFEGLKRYLSEINNLLARNREVDDFRSFLELDDDMEFTAGDKVPKLERYSFTFKNVSFRYPNTERYALKNINLTIEAAETLAVVGLNGSGKTTLIKLLMRLYEPTDGTIYLNGVDIRKYEKQSYYSLFAPVFQQVQIFACSLRENVSMKEKEKTEDDRVLAALTNAGFLGKLEKMENGLDTELLRIVSETGTELSGGEKQKIALARALYKKTRVVIMDEPTAALDALAESRLYQNFNQLIDNKTAVYISHRLSSTQFCDKVAMFQNGEMIEYGTHQELMKQAGRYAKLFQLQAQYYVDMEEKCDD